jgi:hypothetical protein
MAGNSARVSQNGGVTQGENGDFAFDVALSFAGEDRPYVDAVAETLRERGVRVFYDRYAVLDTWGVDLVELFDEVFRSKARFAVVFVSQSYVDKPWPTHERRSAQARALVELGPYLLPVRLDDAELPGLRPTVGYVDARQLTPAALADLICDKLAAPRVTRAATPAPAAAPAQPPPPPPAPAYAPVYAYPPAPAPGYWPYARRVGPRTLSAGMRRSSKVVCWIAALALLPGSLFASSSFQRAPGTPPYGKGWDLMVLITIVTTLAAVLVSWLYDVVSWRQRADDFAILDWPWWHRLLVAAAAVVAPLAVLVVHQDAIAAAESRIPANEGFLPWGESTPYGPPLYFWWLAPSAMLAAHVLCLAIRYVRRRPRGA